MLISQIYSWNETLHIADISSLHHQDFFTVHTPSLYDIPLRVYGEQLMMMDRRTLRNIEFHFKNKSEKSVLVGGFIIRNRKFQ
jgi:hypothetical protein